MSFVFRLTFPALCLVLMTVKTVAQSTVPAVTQAVPAQQVRTAPVTVDLRAYFSVPGVTGPFAQFTTSFGRFNIELLANDAPRHVANFLNYANARSYDNTVIHRTNSLGTSSTAIVQGGGYTAVNLPPTAIAHFAPVALEYKLPNARGTLAAARLGVPVDSATSEWYFNTQDNSNPLGPTNGGGYSVFARVLGTGMTVVDMIGQAPVVDLGNLAGFPLRNFQTGQTQISRLNYILVESVRQVPLYPAAGETGVLVFTVSAANPAVLTPSIAGSILTITPLITGTSSVTVRAADINGNGVEQTFSVEVTNPPPAFTFQPVSQTVADGSTVVMNVTAPGNPRFQWYRNSQVLPGANTATLIIKAATSANVGSYTCVATNIAGAVTSAAATLSVVTANSNDVGRLINLSILTTASSGLKTLTMGAVTGPADLAAPTPLPLVVRAVGPTLNTVFLLEGVLADPQMLVHRVGVETPIVTNDNWGGTATLKNAFSSVGAFELPENSLDSAALFGATTDSYTVQVSGKETQSGLVIAELYDAAGLSRTANTPSLINVSTLTQVDAGGTLAVGFVIGGQTARTVLVRGVGPSLSIFEVSAVMADPRLELFNNKTGVKIAENDDWGGDAQLDTTSSSVGAFKLTAPATKDAVLLITVPPGEYSARLRGANDTGGSAIVEVYAVP